MNWHSSAITALTPRLVRLPSHLHRLVERQPSGSCRCGGSSCGHAGAVVTRSALRRCSPLNVGRRTRTSRSRVSADRRGEARTPVHHRPARAANTASSGWDEVPLGLVALGRGVLRALLWRHRNPEGVHHRLPDLAGGQILGVDDGVGLLCLLWPRASLLEQPDVD